MTGCSTAANMLLSRKVHFPAEKTWAEDKKIVFWDIMDKFVPAWIAVRGYNNTRIIFR